MKTAICYCGAEITKQNGPGWKHTNGSIWCYEEEAGLDDDSRCNADPDRPIPLDGEET